MYIIAKVKVRDIPNPHYPNDDVFWTRVRGKEIPVGAPIDRNRDTFIDNSLRGRGCTSKYVWPVPMEIFGEGVLDFLKHLHPEAIFIETDVSYMCEHELEVD